MTSITIALDDEQAERLQRFTEERGQTLEQAVQSLLDRALPETAGKPTNPSPLFTSTLDLAGIIDDPSVAPLTAREIDEILADESLNPHDELGGHGGE